MDRTKAPRPDGKRPGLSKSERARMREEAARPKNWGPNPAEGR